MELQLLDSKTAPEQSLLKITVNETGSVLSLASALHEILGEDTLCNHVSALFDSRLAESIIETLQYAHKRKKLIQNRLSGSMTTPDELYVTCSIIYYPLREKGIITLQIDESIKYNEKMLHRFFKTSVTPMALLDEEGFFLQISDSFYKCFPEPPALEKIHLHHFLECFQKTQGGNAAEYMLAAEQYSIYETKLTLLADGSVRHFNIRLRHDPETNAYIVKAFDITEQEEIYRRLEHSDQLSITGEIAASIAHEVRNPMTTLHGFLQLLEHKVTGDAHKYVTVIQEEVIRINEILNEMLTLAKPIVDEVTIFSLSVLVDDVLTLLRPKALLDQITVVCDNRLTEPALIQANPNRMKQVLVNLLKNSMEAMDNSGILTVQLSEQEEGMLQLLVSDTGTGMDKEMVETIFNPFVSSKEGGTGLGLPFVKKTITEYGGSVAVSSELGKGTVFYLTMPKQPYN